MSLNKGKTSENLDFLNSINPKKSNKEAAVEGLLSGLRTRQTDSLKFAVEDINSLILERSKLSNDLFKDIDRLRIEIGNFMLEAGNAIALPEKLELRKKLLEIEEIRLQEKLNSWRDIAALKKELRERQKELSEKEANITAIERIMEE